MPVATMVKAVIKALFGSDKKKKENVIKHHTPPTMLIPHYKRIVVDGKEYLVKEILSVNDNEITVLGVDNVVRVIKRRKKAPAF